MKEFNFTVPETIIRHLITVYADHLIMCDKYEQDDTEYSSDYDYHLGRCYEAEEWMRALDIPAEYVKEVVENTNKKR